MGGRRPQETLQELITMFPSFGAWWAEAEPEFPPEDGLVDNVYYKWTHHLVVQEFVSYFGGNVQSFGEAQLERFGSWVNSAVAEGGALENAVSTCLLEHLRQLKLNRLLSPYLSKEAKARSHA